MSIKKKIFFFTCPVIVSLILHLHVFNLDVIGYHVWRQSQTQTVIYNFNFSDNSVFHPQKFDLSSGSSALKYEFPLYQWLIAQVNTILGYSVIHTRFLSFVFFVCFLIGFFLLHKKFVSPARALIVNSLICFSPLLYYYCVNPLPDILAMCFAVWSLYFFFEFLSSKKIIQFVLFSIFMCLAGLVKLPFILFGGVYVVYLVTQFKSKSYKNAAATLIVVSILLSPVFIWYIKVIPTWSGNGITKGILINSTSISQLFNYFQFHLISSVPELLTNYASLAFLLTGFFLFFKRKKFQSTTIQYLLCVLILLCLYFLFELNMIEKVHDYYLMPFVPLIFLVVSFGIGYFETKRLHKFIYLIILISPLTAWLRIDHRWNTNDPGFNKDYLYYSTQMQTLIPRNENCIVDWDDSKFIVLYYLKRFGYSLLKEELSTEKLNYYYNGGAHFFITENLNFNPSNFPEYSFEKLFAKSVQVYKIQRK